MKLSLPFTLLALNAALSHAVHASSSSTAPGPPRDLSEDICVQTNGTVETQSCSCSDTMATEYPTTCGSDLFCPYGNFGDLFGPLEIVGGCSCPPGNSTNDISLCQCPEGSCFLDGSGCVNSTQVQTFVANLYLSPTYGIVPYVDPPSTGSIAGIVGGCHIAFGFNPGSTLRIRNRRLGDDTTKSKTHPADATRHLEEEAPAAVLKVVLAGAEPNCGNCSLAIYDTSSCEAVDIENATALYNTTKLAENPWGDVTFTTDSNGNAVFESKIAHGLSSDAYRGKPFVVHDTKGLPFACGVFKVDDPTTTCGDSGGSVVSKDCSCEETGDFPNTCAVGACSCPPGGEANEIDVCECPADTCFDGIECVNLAAPPTSAPVDAPTDAPVDVPTDQPVNAPVDAPTDVPTTSGAASFKQMLLTAVLLTVTAAGAIVSY